VKVTTPARRPFCLELPREPDGILSRNAEYPGAPDDKIPGADLVYYMGGFYGALFAVNSSVLPLASAVILITSPSTLPVKDTLR